MKKLIAAVMATAIVASMASVATFATAPTKAGDLTATLTNSHVVADADNGTAIAADLKVKPGKTIYYDLSQTYVDSASPASDNELTLPAFAESYFADKKVFKVKFDKGDDNSKMIKKMSLSGTSITGARGPWLKIELNENMTADEFKITPSVSLTAVQNIDLTNSKLMGTTTLTAASGIFAGTKYTANMKLWISNDTDTADKDYPNGTGGVMLKPTKNDSNEITWEDNNKTVATLKFNADSDVTKFFPKLSTKWDDAVYADNFRDGDAFRFSFVGTPAISSTARPILEIANPFVNEDGDSTVAMEDIVVYVQNADGDLEPTDMFVAGTNEDGDEVFTAKTRILGTYVFADAAAAATETVTDEPATDVAPEKVNPGTGR